MPWARTYSAASSHSSIFMLMPRLSRIGLAAAGRLGDEGEILRVARADLQDVGMCRDEFHVALGKHFGDDAEVVFLRRLGEKPQAFLGQALKFVGRGAGLVGAAAQEGRALRLHRLGRGHELLFAFDRAGPGHETKLFARADFLAVDFDDGVLVCALFHLAADQLVALLHAVDVLDLRPGGKRLERLVGVLVSDRGDDGLDVAVDGARLVAELRHFGDDFFDFGQFKIGL